MSVCIVLVTHNRLTYTRKCISALLSDKTADFDLVIWDNASSDGTQEYLSDEVKDPRIRKVILHKENPGPTFAINQVWSKTSATLLGKVDNDCLMKPGWIPALAAAHRDIRDLGAVACWHFRPEDFDVRKGGHKIQAIANHKILRHTHVCGTGFLVKRESFLALGGPQDGDKRHALTNYFFRLASANLINGWYYPFVLQEHMDDPMSSHCLFKDDKSLEALREVTYTLRTHNIKTFAQRLKRRELVLMNLHYGPWQTEAYKGWRGRVRYRYPSVDRIRILFGKRNEGSISQSL